MQQYAQLSDDLSSVIFIFPGDLAVEWDQEHYCAPSHLTPEEAESLRVVPLFDPLPPVYNLMTQSAVRSGAEYVASQWQHKWIVTDLPSEIAATNPQTAATRDAIESMLDIEARRLRWENMRAARAAAGVPLSGDESGEELAIQAEAVALARWERRCWAVSLAIEAAVLAGDRPYPTPDEILAEIPLFQ